MPTFHKSFIKDYIPPDLVDSLYLFSEGIRDDLILGFSVCDENYEQNLNPAKGSVSFTLTFENMDKMNVNYYLYHNITQNRKFRFSETINSIDDYGLSKDTLVFNDLRYSILVTPYSGF